LDDGKIDSLWCDVCGGSSAALGDETLARTFYQQLLEVADGGVRQPALKEAQTYVAQLAVIKAHDCILRLCRPTEACSGRRSAPPLMPRVRPQMRKKSKPTGFAAASDTGTKGQ
jgi:hypothetical protein